MTLYEIKSRRLAEVPTHTPLEAINKSEGMAFKKTTQHPINLTQKSKNVISHHSKAN